MAKKRSITIRDVAKKANVSVSTVSRAFNNYSDINSNTREKIMKISEEMGYMPSVLARGIRTKNTKRLGLFIEDFNEKNPNQAFSYNLLIGFTEYATEMGYEMVLLPNYSSHHTSKLIHVMKDKHLDGVFLMGLRLSDEFYKQAIKGEFPCVLLDIPIAKGSIGFVGSDNIKGTSLAINHLIKNGHKKIAFINGHEEAYVSLQRLDGYYLALTKNDIPIDKSLIYFGDFSMESGRNGVKDLIAKNKDITAIFAASDIMAVGALRELEDMGYRVPEDIEIIGFDDIDLASVVTPSLSTVRQDTYKLGASAATLLINIINGQNMNQIQLKPELILRESTK